MRELFRQTCQEWRADNAQRLGASLAFYTLLSLAPLLVIMIAVAAFVFGRQEVQQHLVWEVQILIGPNAAQAVRALIQGAQEPAKGAFPTILSLLTLLFGASSVVIELQDALNTIWHVPSDNASTLAGDFWSFAKDRLFSFALLLCAGLLLLGSLLWSTWIALMGKWFGAYLSFSRRPLASGEFWGLIRSHRAGLQRHLQNRSARTTGMERCSGRGFRHVAGLRRRQTTYRSVFGEGKLRLHLWRRRLARHAFGVGILFRSVVFSGRRIHQGLHEDDGLAFFRETEIEDASQRRPCGVGPGKFQKVNAGDSRVESGGSGIHSRN